MQLPERLLQGLLVSRETVECLASFSQDLERWSRTINLVSYATLKDSWSRHILDSAQLLLVSDSKAARWCDLGSGGGLPGLVIAILLKELDAQTETTLIESDARKAAFLKTIVQKYQLNAKVIRDRIESAEPQNADVVSARALAPLSTLLAMVGRHMKADGIALLHKGRNFQDEVEEASRSWHFNLEIVDSLIDQDAKILKISVLEPRVETQ